MYASVHADRTGRVLVSRESGAAGMGGLVPTPIGAAVPLPAGARIVHLPRVALGYDRAARARPLGRDRLAVGALLPPGFCRTLFPAYLDDPAARPLGALAYAAVAADERGELVVAATDLAVERDGRDARAAARSDLLRSQPANSLVRQLARCTRENACRAAGSAARGDELPVPLGAPAAERPSLPLDLRSGYAGAPAEHAAFRPSAREIVAVAAEHRTRGGRRISFGPACDGEPLTRIRVVEEAVRGVREGSPGTVVRLETCGSDPAALRRAIAAGVGSVTVRIASARAETYERLHGPVSHRWPDVRASLAAAAADGVAFTLALLVLPGLTDRAAEIDALAELLGELPGGRLELRELGADPLRVLAALPDGPPLGTRAFLDRLAEADHFALRPIGEPAAV